jgi:hypothetical protein
VEKSDVGKTRSKPIWKWDTCDLIFSIGSLKRKLRTTGNENEREWFTSASSRNLTVSGTLVQEHRNMAQEGVTKLEQREMGHLMTD